VNQKEKFQKKKEKESNIPKTNYSLSLEHFKRRFQNKYLGCFHICLGSSKKIKLTKFHLVTIAILANMQNTQYDTFLLHFQNAFKRFPIYQTLVMVGFYSQPAFQP
jgi:hypothetical protein